MRMRRIIAALLIVFVALVTLSGFILVFRFVAPPASALMIERRIESWRSGDKYSPQYRWVGFDRISPAAANAVIASEDQNFLNHYGFDWAAIQRAVDHNENSNRVRGASTLTQQTAKNMFLWSGRTWVRKGLEAYFTVLLEACWGQRRILETYLNVVEFGDGIYGVEAAAQRYFHKSAARLAAQSGALV